MNDPHSARARANRIGVEIGGTFTDLVWAGADGRLHTGKTPSTPAAIHEAVLTVIDEAAMPLGGVAGVTHGSTVATNALIMRKGAAAGLLMTAGFRDIVIVGRGDRDHGIYDMQYRRPFALEAGDLVEIRLPGGGWGDPSTRDCDAVRQDVEDGLIAETAARDIYGFEPASKRTENG